jgi:hypothetical protein
MMEQYEFLVKGNNGNYEIIFTKNHDQLRVTCTCQAGEHGIFCKHRIAILKGDTTNILSGNEAQIAEIMGLLRGTKLEKALVQLEAAQDNYDLAHKQLANAKKCYPK